MFLNIECSNHEFVKVEMTNTSGDAASWFQCRKCGKLSIEGAKVISVTKDTKAIEEDEKFILDV